MKELSIEEKAKAYDEALERAKEMIKATTNIGGVAKVDDIQYIFQLNESEEEKIRKCLLSHFSRYREDEVFLNDILIKDIVSWLEKQGEKGAKGNEREIPNSVWNEEDEKMFRGIITICDIWSTKTSFYPKQNDDIVNLKKMAQITQRQIHLEAE